MTRWKLAAPVGVYTEGSCEESRFGPVLLRMQANNSGMNSPRWALIPINSSSELADSLAQYPMPNCIPIDSLDDPRLAPYRNLKDRELDRAGELFMAEGEYVVRRLLESDYPVVSVLVAERRLAELAPLVREGTPIYVGRQEVFRGLLGIKFQSGVMACGRRKPWRAMEQVIPKIADRLTLMVLPDVSNVQNVGSLIRIAAGFGVDAVVLGEQCHDPFWRQAIRVSMGSIFRMPLYRSNNLLSDIERLKREWNVELAASVLQADAQPLAQAMRPPRFGVLFGNEAQGLEQKYIAACDRRVTIPMKLGTDSLNVGIAAGIFLHHFTQAGVAAHRHDRTR